MKELRPDLAIISEWIKPGSRVLDLGCGDGTLLDHLKRERDVDGYGLEIDPDNIVTCIQRGVSVIQSDLDAGLTDYFDDNSFDYVVMTQTIQASTIRAACCTRCCVSGGKGSSPSPIRPLEQPGSTGTWRAHAAVPGPA